MNIGIDIDGPVVPLYEALIPHVRKWKKDAKLKDLTNYEFRAWEIKGHKLNEILDNFKHTGEYLTLKPRKNAVNVINQMYENNKIYFLTARDQYDGVSWDTLFWLFDNGFKFDGFFSRLKDKHNKIKELEIDLLIDDNPHEVEAEANHFGVDCIIYNRPWNRYVIENQLIKRCKSWKSIEKYLEKEKLCNN